MGSRLKSKSEQDHYLRAVIDRRDEPTKKENGLGTLDDIDTDNDDSPSIRRRKFFRSRFYLHIRDNWINYLMGTIGVLALFFFVNMNVKFAETSKDIFYLDKKLDENTRKIEKVSDDVTTLREQLIIYGGDLKSLDNRFAMFIELFKKDTN